MSSGSARVPLQAVELGRDVERRADRDDQPADVQRVHPCLHPRERCGRRRPCRCRRSRASPAARSCPAATCGRGSAPPCALRALVPSARHTAARQRQARRRHRRAEQRSRCARLACIASRSSLGAGVLVLGLCRGAGAGRCPAGRCGPARHRRAGGGQPAPGPGPRGRPGDEPDRAWTRAGVSDVERLRAAGVRPRGALQPRSTASAARPTRAPPSRRRVDSATGLPIYSLYGRDFAPTTEMLAGVDVMLVDLHDAGARYYTYLSTTIEVMKAAGDGRHSGDRPRPARPDRAARCRATCSTARGSFVGGSARVPMRHGLTLG